MGNESNCQEKFISLPGEQEVLLDLPKCGAAAGRRGSNARKRQVLQVGRAKAELQGGISWSGLWFSKSCISCRDWGVYGSMCVTQAPSSQCLPQPSGSFTSLPWLKRQQHDNSIDYHNECLVPKASLYSLNTVFNSGSQSCSCIRCQAWGILQLL